MIQFDWYVSNELKPQIVVKLTDWQVKTPTFAAGSEIRLTSWAIAGLDQYLQGFSTIPTGARLISAMNRMKTINTGVDVRFFFKFVPF